MRSIFLFFALFPMAASAQTAPDARDLLLRSDAPILAARTYRVEGTLVTETTGPGIQLKTETSFSTAYSMPGRHRTEIKTGQAKILEVSDGESTWIYNPQANTYSKSAAGTSSPSHLRAIVYGRDPANVRSATLERQESVAFGGKPVMCSVVRAEYAGLPGAAKATNVVRTAWIEPAQNLVLRDSWEADLAPPAVPTAAHLRLTLDLSTIEWDRLLAEDLFAFQPPEGSRLVHSFTPPAAILYGYPLSTVGSLPCCDTGPAPAGVFRVGQGVTAPSLRYKVEPQYSAEALKSRYQGTVLLYVQVDPSGKAVNMRVLHSLGLGLDEKAIEAVKKWQFKPGTKDGVPVTVEAQIAVNFRLLGPWRIARQEYDTAAVGNSGVSKPVPQLTTFPKDCKGKPVAVTLSLLVGADGKPSKVEVIRSDSASFEQPAVNAVEHWMFLPARLKGSPQAVSGELELECNQRNNRI
jgi:TonB family protein